MSVQTLSGSFPRGQLNCDRILTTPRAITDWYDFKVGDTTGCQRTTGAIRTAQIPIQQSQMEAWTLLGFSGRLQVATSMDTPSPGIYGQLGPIWLGVALDAPLTNAGGLPEPTNTDGANQPVQLPQDLSTFTVVVPSDMPRPVVANAGDVAIPAGQGLVGITYMLPAPYQLRPGGQLQMVLIAMPSKIGRLAVVPANHPASPVNYVQTCDFTVIYDNNA